MLDYDPDEPGAPGGQGPAPAEAGEREVIVDVAKAAGAPQLSDEKLEELAKEGEAPADEIARYNKQAQKRITSLRAAFAEQRRRTEQFANDATTASNLAERLYRENQDLKKNLARGETALVEQALGRAEAQLQQSTNKYKQALASGDTDLIAAANVEVARAVAEIDRLKLLRPAPRAGTEGAAPAPAGPEPAAPQPRPVSERTKAFLAANPWFSRDQEMTSFALKQDSHLAIDGITEESNPDLYWKTIESKLAERYPDKFARTTAEVRPARPASVTGGTRTGGAAPTKGPVTVRLTESELRIANRLGVSPEQYAIEKLKQESEGKGTIQ